MENQVRASRSVSTRPAAGTGRLSAGEIAAAIKTPKQAPSAAGSPVGGSTGTSSLHTYYNALKASPFFSQTVLQLLGLLESETDDPVLHSLLEKLKASAADGKQTLARHLLEGFAAAGKFQSPVFYGIKQYYGGLSAPRDQKTVLEFARAYDAFLSLADTNLALYKRLKMICALMTHPAQREFSPLLEGYYLGGDYKKILANLALLKKQVFPALNRYVLQQHEYGPARKEISVLMQLAVRLEAGRYETLKKAGKRLFALPGFAKETGFAGEKQLLGRVVEEFNGKALPPQQKVLKELLQRGLAQQENPVLQEFSQEALKALLLSQSCYMPLANLPLLFKKSGVLHSAQAYCRREDAETLTVILLACVPRLGETECVLRLKNDTVALELYGPPALVQAEKTVSRKLEQLLKENGLRKQSIEIAPFCKNGTLATLFGGMDSRKKGIYGTV